MIKLITHNDLDGVGCYIVAKTLLTDDIDVTYCSYGDVNDVALNVLECEKEYDKIFITDISVTEDVANKLDVLGSKLVLIDHHGTAMFLNKFSWGNVKEYEGSEKTCATKLFYDYIMDTYNPSFNSDILKEFVWKTTLFDTWLWSDKYNDVYAKYLNDLRYLLGKDDFVDSILTKINSKTPLFSEFDLKLLAIKQREIDSYVEKKDKDLIVTEIKGYKAGVVFAETNLSELGNRLSELHPELDLIAMVNQNGISYRTAKEDIDVSKIAKYFGGGGHPKASGSRVPKNLLEGYIYNLFNS